MSSSTGKKTRPLIIAVCRGGSLLRLGRSQNKKTTWPAIVEAFREAHVDDLSMDDYLALPTSQQSLKKNVNGAFVGGSFRDGLRDAQHLEFRSMITLDIDTHAESIWDDLKQTGSIPALSGLAYLVHTTRKHTDAKPRLRVLIPLTRDVTPEEYVPIVCGLGEKIDPDMTAVSSETYVSAQVMFYPSVCSDAEYFSLAVDGEFLDPTAILKKYPVDKPESWPLLQGQSIKSFSLKKIVHPEDKKAQAPIITALHRAFHPTTFIEEFLSDIYQSAEGRYIPHGATGAPSVRIYEDAFVQSDHGSDPARGQHNIFDLGRIHLFGHLDEDFDTDSMSPVEWPSYQAMAEWAVEQEGVADHLAEVEEEVEYERNQSVLDMLDELDEEPDEEDGDATDSDDDLVGGTPEKKKPATSEQVLAKVKRKIAKATSLSDLERRVDAIRSISLETFRDLHRDLVAPDLQKKFAELTGEKITKAAARKMLAPTVENLRKQAEGQEIPGWLKPWVYLSQDNKFLNIDTKEMLPKEGFNARFAKEAADAAGINNLGVARLSAADLVWSVYEVPKPYTTRYLPGGPPLFEENSSLFANSYKAAIVESGGYKGREGVKLLKRLLEDLLPKQAHRCMVMDFLVHCVRFPEKKLKYALLIKGAENEGKTLLADLVGKLLGDENCMVINSDALKEKYTGWVYEKLFCTVEEVKVPGREVDEVLNKLKPVITNDYIPVRRMQKDVTRERNFANLFMTTNDEDALRMEVDNTRYLVLFTRFRTNDEVAAWHKKLLDEEGVIYPRQLWEHIRYRPAQFLDAFAKYTFSEHYDPEGRAPMTVFKKIMAEDNKTDERTMLEDILASGGEPGITSDILIWSAFRDLLDLKDMSPHLKNSAIGKFLKPFGYVKAAPYNEKIGKKVITRRVWTRNLDLLDEENTLSAEGRALARAEIEKMEAMDGSDDLTDLL